MSFLTADSLAWSQRLLQKSSYQQRYKVFKATFFRQQRGFKGVNVPTVV